MNRSIATTCTLGALFVVFGIISFLVIVTKRNPYFLSKKLKVGALIISLSGFAVGCQTVSCYVGMEPNFLQINQEFLDKDTITIHRGQSDTIAGTISERNSSAYSYAILDSTNSIFVKENIYPRDSIYDERGEEFVIAIDSTIPLGVYSLRFYTMPKDSIKHTNWYSRSFALKIAD